MADFHQCSGSCSGCHKKIVWNMKKLRLWVFVLLLASTLFLAIAQQGKADSDRPSVNTNGMVRLVYFLPNDRPARPDRVAALRQLIKDAQQFYADEMHKHGFGSKTFRTCLKNPN